MRQEDIISTGDILDNNNGIKFTLIVLGDINQDGKCSLTDLSRQRKYSLDLVELDDIQKSAGDINIDGNISLTDISLLRKRMLGLY